MIAAIRRAEPQLDILTVADADHRKMPDPEILEQAARLNRVVVTSDVQMLVGFAYQRIVSGHHTPGVIVGPMYLNVSILIEDLSLMAVCCEPEEIANQVRWLPLRH